MRTLKAQVPDFSLNVGGQVFNSWVYKAPPEVTPANLTDPEFWAHVARKLTVLDVIDVVARDGSFDGQYRVIAIMGLIVTLRELRAPIADKTDITAMSDESVQIVTPHAKVRFVPRGPHKWRVEAATGEIVSHGHPTKEAAEAAMHVYLASINRRAA
jgi:hypothetical protein